MSTPFSPNWTQALHRAHWAQALHTKTSPQSLHQAACAAPEESWQRAGYKGAYRARALLDGHLPHVACGASMAARAAGLGFGPLDACVAAYPIARLLTGDGVGGSRPGAPTDHLAQLKTTGILGLPARVCVAAAQSRSLADAPVCRTALLGAAVGLGALAEIPRALVGLVHLVAAFAGAAIGIVCHALRRAWSLLQKAPGRIANVIATLENQLTQWSQVLSMGTAFVRRAKGAATQLNAGWQRFLTPVRALGQLLSLKQAVQNIAAPKPPAPGAQMPAITHEAARGLSTQVGDTSAWAQASAQACVRSAAQGARSSIARCADAISQLKEAMRFVQRSCSQMQHTRLISGAWSYANALTARLPQLRLPQSGARAV